MAAGELNLVGELYQLRKDVAQLQRDTAILLDRWAAYAVLAANITSLTQLPKRVDELRADMDGSARDRRESCPMCDRIAGLERRMLELEQAQKQTLIDLVELKTATRAQSAQTGGAVGAIAGAIVIVLEKVAELLLTKGSLP